jgi:hypothetical protein
LGRPAIGGLLAQLRSSVAHPTISSGISLSTWASSS